MHYHHETAVIDQGAVIGDGTKIWHFCHICSGAIIGRNCTIGQNVYISSKVKIGNNVKIQNNVSLYDGVIIEDNVFCGPSVVFTNVRNPRSEINRKNNYLLTKINQGATLGANSTIVCGVSIGKYAFVGAGAVVTKPVKDFALVTGVPAKQIGWISKLGDRLPFDLVAFGTYNDSLGNKYTLIDGIVRECST